MFRPKTLCLLIVALALTACASSGKLVTGRTAQVPQLDSALAAPCPAVADPADDSVDSLVDAHVDLIDKYAICAARHQATVDAWNGLR